MDIKEITHSLDWHEAENQIRELSKSAPEFHFDVVKFCASMGSEIRKLSDIEMKIRTTHRDSYVLKHKDKCKEINRAIKDFANVHLMHLFSRTD